MKRIYLAYGSNMNREQMALRCLTANLLGPAVLEGWRLEFRGSDGNAVATIEPEQGSKVLTVVWELQPEDEAALDRYEGFPFLYRKEMVKAVFNGGEVEAMAYIMNPGRRLGKPSSRYFEVIRQGYKSAGFNTRILENAVRKSAAMKPEIKILKTRD